MIDETRAEEAAAPSPDAAPKPATKPPAPAKKAAAPVVVAATPLAKPALSGIGDFKPTTDAEGRVLLAPQFFTDTHVRGANGAYPVRRFEGNVSAPYVALPGDAQGVAFRTGVMIRDGFEAFHVIPPTVGEGLVVDVETRYGEIYMIVRPVGAQPATVIEGKVMVLLELEQ